MLFYVFRPLLSKISLFRLYRDLASALDMTVPMYASISSVSHKSDRFPLQSEWTYLDTKLSATEYQAAKGVLRGLDGPFVAWKKTGSQWETFTADVFSMNSGNSR